MTLRCPRCGAFAVPRPHDSAYCGACFTTFRPSAPELAPGVRPMQLTVDGGAEPMPAPEPEAPSTHARAEQPRLFEPQYEGQLTMDDYPEIGAEAPER